MADSTLTLTIYESQTDVTERHEIYFGILAISASPDTYPTGGWTLSLANWNIKTMAVPIEVEVKSMKGDTTGFLYKYVPGTTRDNGKLQVLVTGSGSGAAFAELAAGATPSGISGDTIGVKVRVKKSGVL